MKVLRVRPKHYPEVIDIDCSLESLQKEVEGPIQAVYPWDDEVALICNEEGKLHDNCMEKLNRTLDGPYGIPIDIIVGTFLIVGLTEDDFGELLAKYMVGMDDEDHLRAACWNLLWALNQRVTHPELDDRLRNQEGEKLEPKKKRLRCATCNCALTDSTQHLCQDVDVAYVRVSVGTVDLMCPNCEHITTFDMEDIKI